MSFAIWLWSAVKVRKKFYVTNAEKNETKASAGRNGKRKGQGSAKPERPVNSRKKQGRGKQQAPKQQSQSQAPKRATSGTGDMRPGRAHRAAMQKRRNR